MSTIPVIILSLFLFMDPIVTQTIDWSAGSCEPDALLKCLKPLDDLQSLGMQLYISFLQRQTNGQFESNSSEDETESQVFNVCKKAQQTGRCFATYYAECVNTMVDIPYMNKVISNVMNLLKMCDQPDLYRRAVLSTSCDFTGPEFGSCANHLQQLQQALMDLPNVPEIAEAVMKEPNMGTVQRMICCTVQDGIKCLDPVYKEKCPHNAVEQWLAIKTSLLDIVDCDDKVLASCPRDFLDFANKVLEKKADFSSFSGHHSRSSQSSEL